MKNLPALFLVSLICILISCTNYSLGQNELKGKIAFQGITAYQYGSHTFTTKDDFFALRSQMLNLDQYVGKTVIIRFEKMKGYPVDGGPDFLEVLEVK